MGLRDMAGRCARYIRHDLKEIIAPSSLPNPPGTVEERRLTWAEVAMVWRKVYHSYLDTWRSDQPIPGSGPSETDHSFAQKTDSLVKEIKDEFAEVYKSGATGMAPYLQRLAHMRASMVKDSIQSFTEGYKTGLEQAKEELSPGVTQSSQPTDGTRQDNTSDRA